MAKILANAFSIQMLDVCDQVNLNICKLDIEEVKILLAQGFKSVIGHQDTANVLTNVLGMDVAFNRESIKLSKDDMLIVAQLTGGRLPEGATTLPEGARFEFFVVRVK